MRRIFGLTLAGGLLLGLASTAQAQRIQWGNVGAAVANNAIGSVTGYSGYGYGGNPYGYNGYPGYGMNSYNSGYSGFVAPASPYSSNPGYYGGYRPNYGVNPYYRPSYNYGVPYGGWNPGYGRGYGWR